MQLTPEMQQKVANWASRGVVSLCELRGQKQQSGTSTDKKDSSKKNEFHYLELSLECVATGEHIKGDFFGPREVKGPLELIPAPKGSILIVGFSSYEASYQGTKGRVREFEILHRANGTAFNVEEIPPVAKPEKGK